VPRTARELVPQSWYYVESRAGDGMLLFRDTSDFQSWLGIAADLLGRFDGVRMAGWCLLPESTHLLVFDEGTGLGGFMRLLQGRYSRSRTDVFGTGRRLYGAERFHSRRLAGSKAAVDALRLIHQLPASSGLVLFPDMWRWSSCAQWLSEKREPPTVPVEGLDLAVEARYPSGPRGLVDDASPAPDLKVLSASPVYAGPSGSGHPPRMLPADPAGLLAREWGVGRTILVSPGGREARRRRHEAFRECRSRWGMTFAEIARAFGVTPGAVIQALSPPVARPPRKAVRKQASPRRKARAADELALD
jgi:hypothetical protein